MPRGAGGEDEMPAISHSRAALLDCLMADKSGSILDADAFCPWLSLRELACSHMLGELDNGKGQKMARKSALDKERERVLALEKSAVEARKKLAKLEEAERQALMGKSVLSKASLDRLGELLDAMNKLGLDELANKLGLSPE